MKPKRLRFKSHRLLARKEARRAKILIDELRALLLHILTTQQEDFRQLDVLLSQVEATYTAKIQDLLAPIIEQNYRQILRDTNLVFQASGFALVQDTQRTQELISTQLSNHLELIKKIPQDIIQSSRQKLLTSLVKLDARTIRDTLLSISDVSTRRAELIARDQISKANSSLRIAQATDLGYTYYRWLTSRDERVSTGEGGHKQLEGRIYSLTNPTAIIDTQGTKGHPSQRPNCRCVPLPILIKASQTLKLVKNKKEGDYYEIQK